MFLEQPLLMEIMFFWPRVVLAASDRARGDRDHVLLVPVQHKPQWSTNDRVFDSDNILSSPRCVASVGTWQPMERCALGSQAQALAPHALYALRRPFAPPSSASARLGLEHLPREVLRVVRQGRADQLPMRTLRGGRHVLVRDALARPPPRMQLLLS